MHLRSTNIVSFSALLVATSVSVAAAQEVVVHHRVLAEETAGGMATGTLEVWVGNLTGEELTNVDLRPDQADLFAGDNGVLQLGAIPADEARVVSGFFLASDPSRLDGPLSWRADFDGPDGHAQVTVPSISLDLE